jgi:hypothetical protein
MPRIFDLGPQPPVRPTKPQVLLDAVALPAGADGHPAIEPETRRYAEAYADYLRQLDSFPAERAAWVAKHGDAVELHFNPGDDILGREYLDRDPRRYCRTLPDGMVASSASHPPAAR